MLSSVTSIPLNYGIRPSGAVLHSAPARSGLLKPNIQRRETRGVFHSTLFDPRDERCKMDMLPVHASAECFIGVPVFFAVAGAVDANLPVFVSITASFVGRPLSLKRDSGSRECICLHVLVRQGDGAADSRCHCLLHPL